MAHSDGQLGATKAWATFHDTDPDNFIARKIDRKAVDTLVPVALLLRKYGHVRRAISACRRCGGCLRQIPIAGNFELIFPMYGCYACGERVDWTIQVNRFLTEIGCSTPTMYEEGYRRLKMSMLEREWQGLRVAV